MAAPDQARWRAEYPFESHFMSVEGHRYHYIDVGSGDRVVLCVHGNPTWSFYYRRLASQLPGDDADCRVIAVDHLGCGLSDKPQDFPYTLAKRREHLVALIDHLQLEGITMVVHDWGGAIGLSTAIERLERIEGLVILNTGAFPPPYLPKRIAACRLPGLGTLAIRGANAFAKAAITMAVHRFTLPDAAQAGLLAPYGNWHDRVAIDAFVKDIPMNASHPTYAVLEQLEADLPKLADLPARLVWGMRDWCFRPECLRRLQQALPRAKTVELDEVGHYVMEQAPAQVIEGVRGVQTDAAQRRAGV